MNPENIKSMDVSKNEDEKIIKIITKNSAEIPDDVEIYINEKKVSKKKFDELEQSEIQMMNIKEVNSKKKIEIQATTEEEIKENLQKVILEKKEHPEK